MFQPLRIGLPIIFAVVISFVVGMNTVPFDSPFFPFVVGGYAVLFPLALVFTIIGTVRAVKRATLGGDPKLVERGRRATGTVIAAKTSSMTMRVNSGMPMRLVYVTLRIDDAGAGSYELKVTRTRQMWEAGTVAVGTRVPVYIDPANQKNVFVAWNEAEVPFGAASDAVSVQTVSFGAGQVADLSQVPAGLRQMLQMGLNLAQSSLKNVDPSQISPEAAAKLKALGIELNGSQTIETKPLEAETRTAGRGTVRPVEAHEEPVREEGRARIEALQPNPDGTFDLDLFVTPKRRSSYRLSVTLPVPQAHIEKIRRGQYLQALLDPASPETIEIDWEKI